MYKVNYRIPQINAYEIGYTESLIEDIPKKVKEYIDDKYGKKNYDIKIENIQYVDGHNLDDKYYDKHRY